MASNLASLSVAQLRRAVDIKVQIEALSQELNQLLGESQPAAKLAAPAKRGPGRGGKRTMSADARARIAAAQRARWAKSRAGAKPAAIVVAPAARKRRLSAAGRAAIAAAAKARWARAKAAGRSKL